MGYESLGLQQQQTKGSSAQGFSITSLFTGFLSYILLPPLLAVYALAWQFLAALDIIDRIAANKTVQRVFQLTLRAGVVAAGIAGKILGLFLAPFRWFGNTFVYRWIWAVYNFTKKKVYGALGWRVL